MRMPGWAWVLQGVTAEEGPRETGSSGLVEACWVREEGGHLECLVLRNLAGPWEDQGRCYGNQQGLLAV